MTQIRRHAKSFPMRNLFFALFILTFTGTAFAESFNGVLTKTQNDTFISLTKNSSQLFKVKSVTVEASDSLQKLETGDLISANGNIDTTNRVIQLESIDYVGLKKILGLWVSDSNLMNFSTFNNLSIYPLLSKKRLLAASPKTDLQYSVAPYKGNEWAVFLSSKTSTIFATIVVDNDSAVMKIFDTDTGENTRTIRLNRWKK